MFVSFCFLFVFFLRGTRNHWSRVMQERAHICMVILDVLLLLRNTSKTQFSKPRWRRLSRPGRRRQFVNWAPMWRILVDLPRWDVSLASKTAHGGRKGRSILVEGRPGNFIETLAAFENKRSASWACSWTGDSRSQLPYPSSCLPYPFTCIPWAVVVYRKVRKERVDTDGRRHTLLKPSPGRPRGCHSPRPGCGS